MSTSFAYGLRFFFSPLCNLCTKLYKYHWHCWHHNQCLSRHHKMAFSSFLKINNDRTKVLRVALSTVVASCRALVFSLKMWVSIITYFECLKKLGVTFYSSFFFKIHIKFASKSLSFLLLFVLITKTLFFFCLSSLYFSHLPAYAKL